LRAYTDLHFFTPSATSLPSATDEGILIERPKNGTTFTAIEFDVFELRKDSSASGDNTGHSNEAVEFVTTKRSKRCRVWKVSDPDMDFGVNSFIRGIEKEDAGECYIVENGKH
jgi:hypothetical protein